MSNTARFVVEKIREKVLIVGDKQGLTSELVRELKGNGLEIEERLSVDSENQLTSADHLIIVADHDPLALKNLSNLNAMTTKPFVIAADTRLKHLIHLRDKLNLILYSDYIAERETSSVTLQDLVDHASSARVLTIPGEGLAQVHLQKKDAVKLALKEVLFSLRPGHFHISTEPMSILSLANLIRTALPYKVDIVFGESSSVGFDISEELSMLSPKIIKKERVGIEKIITTYTEYQASNPKLTTPRIEAGSIARESSTHKNRRVIEENEDDIKADNKKKKLSSLSKLIASSDPVFVPINKPKPKHNPKKFIKPRLPLSLRVVLQGLSLALSLYLFALVLSLTVTGLSLKGLVQGINSDGVVTKRAIATATPPTVFLQANLTAFSSLLSLPEDSKVGELNRLLTSYLLALRSLANYNDLGRSGSQLSEYVLGEGQADLPSLINQASLDNSALYDSLSLLDGNLPQTRPSVIPERFDKDYVALVSQVKEGRKASLTGKTLLTIAPDILGVGSRRKYAVLFQNNMELRATGGFIGSFGILSLENGKLFDFQIYDVYTADGQLKGHVEPPAEIKNYLGEANWYLRDSNWDPDFPTTARRAEWFLAKTIGQEVQGSIAVNVNTLEYLLEALGSITLEDYNEEVSSANIYERAQYHSEVNFFPGSTQKKEYLSSVAEVLMQKMRAVDGDRTVALARALTKSIDEKHTLLALGDSKTSKTLSHLGWNGEIRNLPCPNFGNDENSSCLSDYLMLVDSNFGVNKANYFVKRKIDLVTALGDNRQVSHTLKVEYTNTATSAAWPAGPYKNYSRLYLPKDAILRRLTIDGQELSDDRYSLTASSDRLVVGFLVNVPLASTVDVVAEYDLAEPLTRQGTYSLYWQKQPGTDDDSVNITIHYPAFLTPTIVSPLADLPGQEIIFSLTNITDRRISVYFEE